MPISVYDDYALAFELRLGDRRALRDAVVAKFLSEAPGYWRGDVKHVTRYRYFVETLADGRRIFLCRPTYLNKGIDFQVWVERFAGVQDARPSHQDVFRDLVAKKQVNALLIPELREAIGRVWNCEEPDAVLAAYPSLQSFQTGLSVELLLKILKWLFIEQDLTYWNYDGREMLERAIDGVM